MSTIITERRSLVQVVSAVILGLIFLAFFLSAFVFLILTSLSTEQWVKSHGGEISVSPGHTSVSFYRTPKLNNLKPLTTVPNLKALRIFQGTIADYSALAEFKDLRHLDLKESNIRDLSPISRLSKLEELQLGKTDVANLNSISGLPALRSLDISDTRVVDLSPISNMKSLRHLKFTADSIASFEPLLRVKTLSSLTIHYADESCLERMRPIIQKCRLSSISHRKVPPRAKKSLRRSR